MEKHEAAGLRYGDKVLVQFDEKQIRATVLKPCGFSPTVATADGRVFRVAVARVSKA